MDKNWTFKKKRNFSARKVLNSYQGHNTNPNTLLITIMGYPASDLIKNQHTQHKSQIKFPSERSRQNCWFWNKDKEFIPKSTHLFLILDNLP